MGLPVTGISYFNVFRVLKNKKIPLILFKGHSRGIIKVLNF